MSSGKYTNVVACLAGCLAGLVVGVSATMLASVSRPKPQEVEPPSVGGQKAPSSVREIDFEKRYDLHCVLFEKEKTVFKNCKVVGFTGPAKAGHTVSGGSSYGSRDFYERFDRWLIVEQGDGRLTYIPLQSLRYLEAAKGP